MKKLLTSLFLIGTIICVSQTASYAQYKGSNNYVKGKAKIGVGILYGSRPEDVGVRVDATYLLSPSVALAPNISIYAPGNNTVYDNFWAVNLNGHYIFDTDPDYDIYALGGFNIASAKYKAPSHNTNSELGINLGIGGEYHLKSASLFGTAKYVVGNYDQIVIGAGVRIPLN